MRCVVVESPFAGRGRWRVQRWWRRLRNVRYARACLRDALSRGEAPIASHLLYTQRGVLRDWISNEREAGILAGLTWAHRADASVVYIDRGVSRGMQQGIDYATAHGIPVEFRSIEGTVIETIEYNGETIH